MPAYFPLLVVCVLMKYRTMTSDYIQYNDNVPYNDYLQYNDNVPYNDYIQYNDNVPYNDNVQNSKVKV